MCNRASTDTLIVSVKTPTQFHSPIKADDFKLMISTSRCKAKHDHNISPSNQTEPQVTVPQ